MKKLISILSLFLFINQFLIAKDLDTNYVRKYKNKLVIGYFQSYRRYELTIGQKIIPDSTGLSNLKYT